MGFKQNRVKVDLASYPHYVIMGQRKVGKTTFFHDLVRFVTGSSLGGVLISCGREDGYKAIDGIIADDAFVWDKEKEHEDDDRGLLQIVDDLVENRNTEHKDIKLVALDTLDELVEIAIAQVMWEHRKAKGRYPESINGALGGFGAGARRVIELINGQVARLNRAGYAVFIIAHTKTKDKEDPLTGQVYEQITNNLSNNYYTAIADTAQMVVNFVTEREIKEGKVIGTKRMMYFRDNGIVDAGGRFPDLPEKLDLSAENFMKAFEHGVKSAMQKDISDKEMEKIKKQELEVQEKTHQKLVEEENVAVSERKEEFSDKIKEVIKEKCTGNKDNVAKVKAKMDELGVTMKDLNDTSLDNLRQLALFLKDL